MLSIGKLGKGQEAYYTEKVAEGAEDYYSGESEAQGVWMGDAAAELGLEGTVDPKQLTAMLTGRNPATGEPLGLRHVAGKGPVPGFDLTFSIPKSASLLWALGGPDVAAEVKAAHQIATKAGLDYLQRQACWTRRGAGGREFVKGNGFLAAGYLHRSSRAGDPQIHTHVLVANATKGPDGHWTRLYHPAIYEHAKTASYIAEAQLRYELSQRLGVRWQEVRNGIAEIEGFADSHLREFSTRRKQILEAAGPDASARSLQVATLATREAKEEGVSHATLRERWAAKAEEIGLTPSTLKATMGHEVIRSTAPTIEQLDLAVTAHASHFDRRDAIQAVADFMQAGAPAQEVERIADAFLASEVVLSVGGTKKAKHYTTVRIWEIERKALDEAEQMTATENRAVAGELIAARAVAKRPGLKADQRAMVKRLLTGGEALQIVIGEAGTGKTYAVLVAAGGWAEAGIELRAAAPTWRAANVLRSEGLEATSIARLLYELGTDDGWGRPTGLPPNSVLLIDEAGMVDSATLARLIDHAQAAEAKLVLIGDPEQLGEIEAGGLFRAIAERSEPILLDEVIRHHHDLDREAAKRIREGKGAEGLSLYRSEERVVVAPDADARREAMVADWWQSFKEGTDALMVAKRNVEVERLNELAREVMRAQGRLGEAEIEVGEARFAAGDQVITRVNDHANRIYNRERWRVAEVDPRDESVALDGIDTARRVCVDAVYLGRITDGGDPALQHAYAATIYQAQGSTVDSAYVMADSSMDKQELYVAASRSREETWLYATPEIQSHREEYAPRSPHLREGLQHIAEAAERDGAQTAAHEEALRCELAKLPAEELATKRSELGTPARFEAQREESYARQLLAVEERRNQVEQAIADREATEALGWRERRQRLPYASEREELLRERLAEEVAQLEQMELPGSAARREREIAGQVLTERRELVITAARVAPPPYITREMGERPYDPAKRKAWERGVKGIERYREEHGVTDRHRAFGPDAKSGAEHIAQEQARRRLAEAQRPLGRQMEATPARSVGRAI